MDLFNLICKNFALMIVVVTCSGCSIAIEGAEGETCVYGLINVVAVEEIKQTQSIATKTFGISAQISPINNSINFGYSESKYTFLDNDLVLMDIKTLETLIDGADKNEIP